MEKLQFATDLVFVFTLCRGMVFGIKSTFWTPEEADDERRFTPAIP